MKPPCIYISSTLVLFLLKACSWFQYFPSPGPTPLHALLLPDIAKPPMKYKLFLGMRIPVILCLPPRHAKIVLIEIWNAQAF